MVTFIHILVFLVSLLQGNGADVSDLFSSNYSNTEPNTNCDNYCSNNQTCIDNSLYPSCFCSSGYYGITCETKETKKNKFDFQNEIDSDLDDLSSLDNEDLIQRLIPLLQYLQTIIYSENPNYTNIIIPNAKIKTIQGDIETIAQNCINLVNIMLTKIESEFSNIDSSISVNKNDDDGVYSFKDTSHSIGVDILTAIKKNLIKSRFMVSTNIHLCTAIFALINQTAESYTTINQTELEPYTEKLKKYLNQSINNLHVLNGIGLDPDNVNYNYNNLLDKIAMPINLYQIRGKNNVDYEYKAKMLNDTIVNSNNSYHFYITAVPSNISKYLYSGNHSSLLYIGSFNYSESSLVEMGLTDIDIGFKLEDSYDSFQKEIDYYAERNVDILTLEDDVFTQMCYKNVKLNFDLTQNYRYNKLFKGSFIIENQSKCRYNGYNFQDNYVMFKCSSIDKTKMPLRIKYQENNSGTASSNSEYLLFKCTHFINQNISKNLGIWMFFVLWLLFIIIQIILFYVDMDYKHVPDNADAINEEDEKEKNDSEGDIGKYLKEDDEKISYCNILRKTFTTNHPIIAIFNPTFENPAWYNLMIIFLSIHSIFGIIALLFVEEKIEKRIEDTRRNKFTYPLIKEYDQILIALVGTAVLCILNRILVIIKSNNIKIVFRSRKDYMEISKRVKPRRIASAVIIIVICLAFWFFSMDFCAIYPNTQIGWLYGALWGLIFYWVVLCCIYVMLLALCFYIIEIIEKRKGEENEEKEE